MKRFIIQLFIMRIFVRIKLDMVVTLAVAIAVVVLVINSVTVGYRDMTTLVGNIYLEETVHQTECVSLIEYFLSVIDALAERIEEALKDWQKLRKDQRLYTPNYPRPALTDWRAPSGIHFRLSLLPYWPRAPPITGGVRGPIIGSRGTIRRATR